MTIWKIFSRRFFWAQPQVSSYNRLEIIEIQRICKHIWKDVTPVSTSPTSAKHWNITDSKRAVRFGQDLHQSLGLYKSFI